MSKARITMSTGWRWRLADAKGSKRGLLSDHLKAWSPVSSFPSVIQMELLTANEIPDPNMGQNERLIQWVSDCDWEYSCSFEVPENVATYRHVDLFFEGLDTFATIFLNGQKIGESENMFLPLRVSVQGAFLKPGNQNELRIFFESPVKWGTRQEEQYGKRKLLIRDPKRMYARKAQSHYGWDWGPVILTSGPYMPVHLEMYNARIENVRIVNTLSKDHQKSDISVLVDISSETEKPSRIRFRVLDGEGGEVATTSTEVHQRENIALGATMEHPKLWWPNGQGPQNLYKGETTLLDSAGQTLDRRVDQFGVRTIKLIQKPLLNEPGETFLFNVNGRDIFSQGCNWIPADNLLPRLTRERYFAWTRTAQRCNMNMIRVWGGGIYETEDFYDACDEMGLLVWQDYAFACGDYPVHDKFLKNVRDEAVYQTYRLHNRASLALLCGGNEDFMTVDLFFKDVKFDHFEVAGPFDDKPFPQRKIYLDLLPKVSSSIAPHIDYWANSPWKGDPSDDHTMGDAHVWDVWHGPQLPYQKYGDLSARFVSEFGMHGFPVMRTVETFFSDREERYPQSRAVDCHNKGHGAETRIARYLSENFRYDMKLENFVYCSQLLQSEAYGYALRDWKRKFNGPGKESCSGALIWQLNDIYPVTSWAFVDYFLRPKPAFYNIRRCCAPVSIGISRTPRSRWYDEDRPQKSLIPSFEIFAHNTTPEDIQARLELSGYDMHTHTMIPFPPIHTPRSVVLQAGQNTELYALAHQGEDEEDEGPITNDSLIVLCARLVDPETGVVLSRVVDWPEPFRYLHWPCDTKVSAVVRDLPGGQPWLKQVLLSSNYPVKGCFVSAVGLNDADAEPEWDDNMIDLMPGEDVVLNVNGLPNNEVSVRFLGDWEL